MWEYIWAHSRPRARPPSTTIEAGLLLKLRASTFVRQSTFSMPGILGIRGDDPVATTNFLPSTLIPSTFTRVRETNLAFPRNSLVDGSDLRTSAYFSFLSPLTI